MNDRGFLAEHIISDPLEGTIDASTPLSWRATSYLLFIVFVGALSFVLLGSYNRVQIAQGIVTSDKGVARIVIDRPGTIESIVVSEGSHVRAGDALVTVRSENRLIGGDTLSTSAAAALRAQNAAFDVQIASLTSTGIEEQNGIRDKIAGSKNEVARLDEQVVEQRELTQLSQEDYDRARQIADRGFISKRDIDSRMATLVSRRQQLANLMQQKNAKEAEIASMISSIAQAAQSTNAQISSVRASQAGLSQQLAQSKVEQGYTISSPVSGLVAAVTGRMGEKVTASQELMAIIPDGSRSQIELHVPPESSGLLSPGQSVHLSVDAFPFQTYGSIVGRVRSISSATVLETSRTGLDPVYIVIVDVPKPWISVGGKREFLRAGMTTTARINVGKRSLFNWLFEPLLAVARR